MARLLRNLAVAIVVILVVETWVVGSYRVTSPSMEPTLRDGPRSPDRLLAWKLASRSGTPSRFALVVFERPESELPLVKRVVGLGGERVQIDRGDVRVSKDGGALHVLRKSLAELRSVAVEVASSRGLPRPGETWDFDPTAWESVAGGVRLRDESGAMRFLRVVRIESPTGDPEGEAAGDLLLRLEIRSLPPGSSLAATLAEDGEWYGFEASTGGAPLALLHNGEARGGVDRTLPTDRHFVLEFWNADDRWGVAVDGEEWTSIEYEPPPPGRSPAPGTNGASFELRGAGATLGVVSLSRDLHYTQRGTYGTVRPHAIPPGHVFVLGDNSARSEDSREWGEIPIEALRARPFVVFWPPSRWRSLP